MIYRIDYLKRVAVRSKLHADIINYRKLRNNITSMIRKEKQLYFDKITRNHIDNPKLLWSELHKVTGISKSHDVLPSDITANEMNEHFINISNTISSSFDKLAPVWHNPQCLYKF